MIIYQKFKKSFKDCSPKIYGAMNQYKLVIKYLISGGFSAFVDLFLLFAFTEFFGFYYLVSSTLAFIAAFFVSFFLQKLWTFRDTGSSKKMYRQMAFYFLIGVINLGANAFGMYLLVTEFAMMYIFAQIIMGALLAVSSFMINKLFIFKKKRKLRKMEGVERKRILIATGIFPPAIGGPATYSKTLLQELPNNGFDVKVVTYGNEKSSENVFFISIKQNLLIRYFKYFLRVWKLRNWAHLVYIQGPVSEGLPSFLACRLSGKKYILKVVGDYAWEHFNRKSAAQNNDFIDMEGFQNGKYDFKTQLLRKIEKMVAKNAETVVVPSNYLKRIVRAWGIEEDKIKVIYNSVKKASVQINKEEAKKELNLKGDIIFTSARLVPWKGMGTLIELMPGLLKANSDFKLVINGDGPERHNLEEKSRELGLGEAVIFTGSLEQEKVWHYMRASDIFILNTGYEGLPHIVIEAMQIGIPVITTNIGGNPEVVENGKNGILVEYDNKEEIKKEIIGLLSNKQKQEVMVNEAKDSLSKFSREEMITNIVKLLREYL